jgi:hypothetical protein
MHLVTVNDAKTGLSYQYDADHRIATTDDGLGFFVSQLSNVEAKIYEAKYRNIVFQDFIPVDTSDPEWVDEVTYISYDAVTVAKFLGSNAKDLPESDLTASKSTIPVFYGGNAFSYSLDELRKSQALRIPVDVTKGRMSYRGFQELAQRTAFFGDASRNITGLFNNANVPLDTSLVDWTTATGQQIVDDMNGLLIKVWQTSTEVHVPNVLILPSNQWAIISSRRMDSGTDTTILNFFKQNNLFTDLTGDELTVRQNFELKTAGTANANRMLAYELNDENLTMRMPLPWRSLAPQPDGLRIKVPAEFKLGGTEWRYPLSAAYRDFL